MSGGNGDYTYFHDAQTQPGPVFAVYGADGSALVHTITVRSSDGQEAGCSYYIPPEERGYHQEKCDG
ncbi:MAG: hypothetical protein M5R40_09185 [Anaerolineae bacterium]|nr:hypothetical protein [Anaerolineae bacterium]